MRTKSHALALFKSYVSALKSYTLVLFVAGVAALAPSSAAFAKPKKDKPAPRGTPVLWHDRRVESLDLFDGPGGRGGRPDLRRLQLIKEEKGGWSKKFRVRDASGREWVAKIGEEAQSETAAVRLVWAAGYVTEINYLAPCAHIPGVKVDKKFERCEGDGIANVRFEARPKNIKRAGTWSWKANPFLGSRQLQGLKVLMALLNNWDLKDQNNVRLYEQGRGGRGVVNFAISDLGATFGKEGSGPGFFWRITRSRNNPDDYAGSKFIDKVERGYVDLHYTGKNRGLFDQITVADARWLGEVLSRLGDRQLAEAFRAANYTPEETQLLASVVRARINTLAALR
ncbi:MAG TPA: hypothetical protein VFA21_14160 [Pyrinomonadaceae bacterium]|nr:hypothetical protein [Pyrinomonadaceae bacterium]